MIFENTAFGQVTEVPTMAIGYFPYAMPREHVLEVLASRKVEMVYKRRRWL